MLKVIFNFGKVKEAKVNKGSATYKENNSRVGTIANKLNMRNVTALEITNSNAYN